MEAIYALYNMIDSSILGLAISFLIDKIIFFLVCWYVPGAAITLMASALAACKLTEYLEKKGLGI